MTNDSEAKAAVVTRGARVTLHYEIRMPDDRVVDSTFETEPFSFTVGDGSFEPALEEALLGMVEGEQTRILLTPEFAFGPRNPELVHEMPRAHFPADMPLVVGHLVEFNLPTGEPVAGQVEAVTDEMVTVDFNHPLAGHNIQFIVNILSIEEAA